MFLLLRRLVMQDLIEKEDGGVRQGRILVVRALLLRAEWYLTVCRRIVLPD